MNVYNNVNLGQYQTQYEQISGKVKELSPGQFEALNRIVDEVLGYNCKNYIGIDNAYKSLTTTHTYLWKWFTWENIHNDRRGTIEKIDLIERFMVGDKGRAAPSDLRFYMTRDLHWVARHGWDHFANSRLQEVRKTLHLKAIGTTDQRKTHFENILQKARKLPPGQFEALRKILDDAKMGYKNGGVHVDSHVGTDNAYKSLTTTHTHLWELLKADPLRSHIEPIEPLIPLIVDDQGNKIWSNNGTVMKALVWVANQGWDNYVNCILESVSDYLKIPSEKQIP